MYWHLLAVRNTDNSTFVPQAPPMLITTNGQAVTVGIHENLLVLPVAIIIVGVLPSLCCKASYYLKVTREPHSFVSTTYTRYVCESLHIMSPEPSTHIFYNYISISIQLQALL